MIFYISMYQPIFRDDILLFFPETWESGGIEEKMKQGSGVYKTP